MRKYNWTAIGKAELIAAKGRQPSGIADGSVIEVVACVQSRVAQELEDRAVKAAAPRASDDIGKAGRSQANLRGHPAGARLDLLDRIHIEVGKRGAAHLRIADVSAVHCEDRLHAALPVDRELLGKVGCSVCIRHCSRRKQQQLAEVSFVQG